MSTYVHREFFTIFGQCINVLNYKYYYMAGSASRQDEANPVF